MFLGFWKTLNQRFFAFLNLQKTRPYSHVLEAGDARMITSVVWLFDFYGYGSLKKSKNHWFQWFFEKPFSLSYLRKNENQKPVPIIS
jgi:hypothetical protein